MSNIEDLQSAEPIAAQPCINLNNFNLIVEDNNVVLEECLNDLNLTYLQCCRIDADDPNNRDVEFCYDSPINTGFLNSANDQSAQASTRGIDLQFLPDNGTNPLSGVFYSDFIAPFSSAEGCLIELTASMDICFSKTPFTTFSFLFELEVACQGASVPFATQGFSGLILNTAGSVDCITYPVRLLMYIERYECIQDLVLRWKNPVITPAGSDAKGLSLTFNDMCIKGACN